MKLGDVLKKERERKRLTVEDVTRQVGIPVEQYEEMEAGISPVEVWGPRLALAAIALRTPTSRLISETGKSSGANLIEGQCGKFISTHRQRRDLSTEDLAKKLAITVSEMESIEGGTTPLETYGRILLSFAETIDQPIFNLFYPCGLPFDQLTDYP